MSLKSSKLTSISFIMVLILCVLLCNSCGAGNEAEIEISVNGEYPYQTLEEWGQFFSENRGGVTFDTDKGYYASIDNQNNTIKRDPGLKIETKDVYGRGILPGGGVIDSDMWLFYGDYAERRISVEKVSKKDYSFEYEVKRNSYFRGEPTEQSKDTLENGYIAGDYVLSIRPSDYRNSGTYTVDIRLIPGKWNYWRAENVSKRTIKKIFPFITSFPE